jgi:hypothetical protein
MVEVSHAEARSWGKGAGFSVVQRDQRTWCLLYRDSVAPLVHRGQPIAVFTDVG